MSVEYVVVTQQKLYSGLGSSGNAWERRSQSYFGSGNSQRRSQERNSPLVIRCTCAFVNTPRLTPNS